MENRGRTRFLFYNVVGQQCPSGMTVENCGFRKRLQKIYDVQRIIGYRVLENGNISVCSYVNIGENEPFVKVTGSTVFDLEIEKLRSCRACKNSAKILGETANAGMQTIVYAHTFKYVECPEQKVCKTCPLREELKSMENQKSIGYRELDNGKLLIPKGLYNPVDNKYQDFEYLQEQVCSKCKEDSYQR